jgi:hypothetical protein
MDTHYFIQNNHLLYQAQCIFGDIVAGAYLTTVTYEEHKKEYIKELEEESLNFCFFSDTFRIDLPTNCEIVLEFENGKFVEFTNSEWAAITDVTEQFKDYKKA